MKTVALVTQKGGSGKSTLAVSLAVAAQEAGERVAILEMDRQATATQWGRDRKGAEPQVAFVDPAGLAAAIERTGGAGYTVAFVDTPGVDNPGTGKAIEAADLCLVPCRPTPTDLRAMAPTLAVIHRLGRRFAFVLNQTPPRSFRVRDTLAGLKMLGMLADVNVVARTDHQDAIGRGQGVTEYNSGGAAAAEIRKLWAWIGHFLADGAQQP